MESKNDLHGFWESPLEKAFNRWIERKKAEVSGAFWDGLDGVSMVAMCALQIMSIFGLEWPKRWQIGIVATYVTLQFIKYAWIVIHNSGIS